jgi:hypothetical protein
VPDNETKTTPLPYRQPTPLDLRNGPILVQVRDTETEPWIFRYLFWIADDLETAPYPYFCRTTRICRMETRYKFSQIV